MNKRISVGAVSYLNTRPLLFGLKQSEALMDRITLIEDYPSKIAEKLLCNEIDIGLIPVAMIPKIQDAQIVTDYCIGTENEVVSVAIFSEVPLVEVDTILLDYQSRTSVNLAKILLKEFWNKEVNFVEATLDFRSKIKGTTAAVVIGDRALEQIKLSEYMYDLGAAWKLHTGLPFVFAAWVANKSLDELFLEEFNAANAFGVNHIKEVLTTVNYEGYDIEKYFTQNLSYTFTKEKREGLKLFLNKLEQLKG